MKRKVKVIFAAAILTLCTALGGCKAVESKLEPVYEAILQDDSVQEEKSVQASENQEISVKEPWLFACLISHPKRTGIKNSISKRLYIFFIAITLYLIL